ncbi:MAG: hypothetical protein WCR72_17120 [Bacteroidota bacterium]
MTDNRINFSVSDADQGIIRQCIQSIMDILQPHTVVLSDTDRKTLPKMADGNLPFVEKALSYAISHPQFKPDYINADEMAVDVQGYKISSGLLALVYQLVRLLEDISILSGSEAYLAALSLYRNVQVQSRDGRPGALTVTEDLQERFKERNKQAPAAK